MALELIAHYLDGSGEKESNRENVDIDYVPNNHLDSDYENKYYRIQIICCDFGAPSPDEQEVLSNNDQVLKYRAVAHPMIATN